MHSLEVLTTNKYWNSTNICWQWNPLNITFFPPHIPMRINTFHWFGDNFIFCTLFIKASCKRQGDLIFVWHGCAISLVWTGVKSSKFTSQRWSSALASSHIITCPTCQGSESSGLQGMSSLHFAHLNIYATFSSAWITDGSIHVEYLTPAACLHLKVG